jgi:thymidylate synthase
MQQTFVEATTIPDAWFQLVYENVVNDNAVSIYEIEEGSWVGHTRRQFHHATIRIKSPNIDPWTIVIPDGLDIPNPMDEDTVQKYKAELADPTLLPNQQYNYAERMHFKKLISAYGEWETQFEAATRKLRDSRGNTNQACISISMPEDIWLEDPPCLRSVDCKVVNGALHWTVYFRSWDLFAGFPCNLAALQEFKEIMAMEAGFADGELWGDSAGLHLYDYQEKFAEMRVGKNKLLK